MKNPVSKQKYRRGRLRAALFLLTVATIITLLLRFYIIIRNEVLVEEIYTLEIVVNNPTRAGGKEIYTLPYLIRKLESKGVRNPRVVVSQSLHEASNPRDRSKPSRIGAGNRNIFGMKINGRGYAINYPYDPDCSQSLPCVDCVHACYSSFDDSILDFAAWQEIRLRDYERYYKTTVVTDEDYLHFLNNIVLGETPGYRYAEDPNYTRTLRNVWFPRVDKVLEYYKSHESKVE